MKKIIGICLCVVVLQAAQVSAFEIGREEIEASFKFGRLSKYVNIIGKELHKKQAIQEEFSLTHPKSGLYAGVWFSQSPDGKKNLGDEFDYYIGAKKEIGPVQFNFSYTYLQLERPKLDNLNAWRLKLSSPKLPLYSLTEYVHPAGHKGPHEGWLEKFGITDYVRLPKLPFNVGNNDRQPLFFDVSWVVSFGSRGVDTGLTHVRFGFWLPLEFGNFTLSPSYNYQVITGAFNDGKKGDIGKGNLQWGGVMLRYKF